MACGNTEVLVQRSLDSLASPAERARLEAHVAACPACTRSLERARQLRAAMHCMPERRVSDDFEGRLLAAVRQVQPVPAPAAWCERFRLRQEWRLRVPALVTASGLATWLVVAVVASQIAGQQIRHQARLAHQERQSFVRAAVHRHAEIEAAAPADNWDAMDASLDLSAGILSE